MISQEKAEELIRLTQEEAEIAISEGNVPIASVLTDSEGNVVERAHNTQNTDNDPSAHAEMNILRALGKRLHSRHFDDHNFYMFGNAEPCSMCVSACIKCGIRVFYYGAAAESSMDPWLPVAELAKYSKQPLELHGPILGDECAAQIKRGREALG